VTVQASAGRDERAADGFFTRRFVRFVSGSITAKAIAAECKQFGMPLPCAYSPLRALPLEQRLRECDWLPFPLLDLRARTSDDDGDDDHDDHHDWGGGGGDCAEGVESQSLLVDAVVSGIGLGAQPPPGL